MRRLLVFMLLAIVCSLSPIATAQMDRAKVIVAYLNNFANYTKWPKEAELKQFSIVLISDNDGLAAELEEFASKRSIKGKPIRLIRQKGLPVPAQIQMLILTEDKSDLLLDAYSAIEGRPILLVSENYADKRNVMINLYVTKQSEMTFEVNHANITNQSLELDPEVLLAGGTSIDVASLFRNSQINMREMQKRIDFMDDSLNRLHNDVLASTDKLQNQEKEILAKNVELNNQKEEIDFQKSLITEISEEARAQSKIINAQKELLGRQQDSIRSKSLVLQKQLAEIEKHNNDIQLQLRSKDSLETLVDAVNNDLVAKNIVLGSQSQRIDEQDRLIFLITVSGVLAIFLVIAILVGYRNNKQKTKILALQKKEIEEKLIELEIINKKLQDADQYKSIFLASMSHELRTPLNSIIGYTGILLMGLAGELNAEQKLQLNKVKNNGAHLLSLINDVLDISKIEAERVELYVEDITLSSLITEISDTVRPKVDEKKLDLVINIYEDCLLTTDKRRLKQVILNLVINAVNYSEEGVITVSSVKTGDNRIKLSVSDTGVGISEADMARLFQPFQQVDVDMTKHSKGTGLGLYLTKKLIKLLGGEIFVASKYGEGSEFWIEFPINFNLEKINEKNSDN